MSRRDPVVTSRGNVKLLGFGIAKLLADVAGLTMQAFTRKGARPMTLEYASPEQVLGVPVSPASDVYSLGVILYRLLTGRSPYNVLAGLSSELPRHIVTQNPRPPSTLGVPEAELSDSLRQNMDRIVSTALRKEPTERYATAGELAADLRRCASAPSS